ncbi:MAG: tRNA 2-thiouridine(34) synthase MnmA [Actinomycetota bacterium]|nr:tRNA 2-thiouridine(34) synthase MnmA [Actinomycetota bacterium]
MSRRGSVLVAMSGGVDSSVAACLLLEEGYEVLGSHMNLVHLDGVEHGCCGPRARADAAEVARIAGFGFEVVDMSETFERTVLADFFSEHEAGRTPNPCIRCNESIKFGAFLERAEELGIGRVATGHYARVRMDADGTRHLLRGADRAKDQSYVLHTLGQRELARSLFPLGGMAKHETREHAERLGLPVAGKPDSQEVCFVPGADHAAFLEEHRPDLVRTGDIVDPAGDVIGTHDGSFRYTIGQRRGLGVSSLERAYVVEIDRPTNRVVVGPEELLGRGGLSADRVSWVAGAPPMNGPFEAEVRVRSHGEDVPSVVDAHGTSAVVEFATPQRGIAPGQSVVFYRGDKLLGGGRIRETSR